MTNLSLGNLAATCLVALGIAGTAASAQEAPDSAISSLIVQYENADTDGKLAAANRFMWLMDSIGFTECRLAFDADSNPDTVEMMVWYWAGEYFYDIQDYDRARRYALQALPLCTDNIFRADCHSLLSIINFRKSDYSAALNYAKLNLEANRLTNDRARISSALNTIAGIYLASKQPAEGERYICEAIELSTAAADSTRLAIQCGMASEIYHSIGNDTLALDYATRACIIDSLLGHTAKIGVRLSQMATSHLALGHAGVAQELLNRAIPILRSSGMQTSLAICHNQMGALMAMQGRADSAARCYATALGIFEAKGDLYNESKSRQGLFEALRQSDPAQAMTHLERYAALKDSLYRREMQQVLAQYDAKYRNAELLQQNERARQEKRTIVIAGIAALALLTMGIALMLHIVAARRRRIRMQRELLDSKERFFTNVTHEFRTPLTVISAAAQTIADRTDPQSDIHTCAADIMHHQQRLLNLVNQILDIARMSAPDLNVQPEVRHGDIVGYVAMICEAHRPLADGKGVGLTFAPQTRQMEADFAPDYINKIMQNLIANAIKFSKPGTDVLITLAGTEGGVRIHVSDCGCGMTAEQKSNIFMPFYQADTDSRNIGSGIGLAVVKLTVDAMGGRIGVHSAPGRGTTFVVDLPLGRRDADALPLPAAAPAPTDTADTADTPMPPDDTPADTDADTIRILIVEDTPEVARYIRQQLNPAHCYLFAPNGTEGLAKAEQTVPDVIITDVMMPGMDGFELCRRIRSSELLNHIPVVMVTAKATHADHIAGLEAGADAYFEKPFHADELNLKVEKLLEQHRLLREKYSGAFRRGEKPDTDGISAADKAFVDKFADRARAQMTQGKIDYDALAYDLCLSRTQLNRKLKAITGCTTTDFILQIRIDTAKRMLDDTDLAIYEIAQQLGMDNTAYFNTLFKKATGITPTQWRTRPRT